MIHNFTRSNLHGHRPSRSVRCARDLPTAARIAAVPYDVVNTEEARALAEGNPLSFLRVSRAEIELPPARDPYCRRGLRQRAAREFRRAAGNRRWSLEDEPSLYLYRLRMGAHEQIGLAGCFSLDEYDRDVIKKHERTRRDKEDDRTRHMIALGAQTGPVFLTYRARPDVDRDRGSSATPGRAARSISRQPTACATRSGASTSGDRDALVAAFAQRFPRCTSPTVIIGRRAPPARAPSCGEPRQHAATTLGDGADCQHVSGGRVPARSGADPAVQPGRQGSRRARRLTSSSKACASASTSTPGPADPGAHGRDRDVSRGRVAHAAAAHAAGLSATRSRRSTSACCRTSCSRRF